MESNVTKILIENIWKRCVSLPLNSLQRGMTLPCWCSLSLMTLPSEATAIPLPKKKRAFPKADKLISESAQLNNCKHCYYN